jgi:anti-anti-sigma factor
MDISISTAQGRVPVTILRLHGDLDMNNADQFNTTAKKAIDDGARDILLDFSHVQFMSSIGIRSLILIYDWLHPAQDKEVIQARAREGGYKAPHLKLLKPQDRILKTLQFVNMDAYLEIFDDEDQAVAAF